VRLLYASLRPPFPLLLGGAARSTHHLLSALAKEFGVECLALGSRDFATPVWSLPRPNEFGTLGLSEVADDGATVSVRCGYTVRLLRDFTASLARAIDEFAPDAVWAQMDGADGIVRAARARGARTVFYSRNAEDAPAMLTSLAETGARIVCNSRFVAERVQRITGHAPHVIYPSLGVELGVNGDPRGRITMIGPNRVKGIDTFLEIARLLPGEKFLLVESWPLNATSRKALGHKLAALPNVVFSPRVPDVREIYRLTRLLLVPSVWEEGFGRVVIEAQSCRIPVVASQRGGLPEAVHDGGACVRDYLDPREWVSAIQRIVQDDDLYRRLAERAHAHATAETFSARHAARRFLDVCADASAGQPATE
jgi:glycosyltransferase involved in cell wall biosynthesis